MNDYATVRFSRKIDSDALSAALDQFRAIYGRPPAAVAVNPSLTPIVPLLLQRLGLVLPVTPIGGVSSTEIWLQINHVPEAAR